MTGDEAARFYAALETLNKLKRQQDEIRLELILLQQELRMTTN